MRVNFWNDGNEALTLEWKGNTFNSYRYKQIVHHMFLECCYGANTVEARLNNTPLLMKVEHRAEQYSALDAHLYIKGVLVRVMEISS